MTHQGSFMSDVTEVLDKLGQMLYEKNRKYGDAALNPNQIFSSASPAELINIRIDDKLSRIKNRQTDEDEDPEWDLMGYLVLKHIAKMREASQQFEANKLIHEVTKSKL